MIRGANEQANVDWSELRRRMEVAGSHSESSDADKAEREQRILVERAQKLARPESEESRVSSVDHVVFRLGRETYAIQTSAVLGVFRLSDLARLPGAKAPVHGVTLWRGEVLTVFDLRSMLGVSTTALNDLGRVIVVDGDRTCFGFLADSVSGEVPIMTSEIHALPGSENPLVRGVTPEAVVVLSSENLLLLTENRSHQ